MKTTSMFWIGLYIATFVAINIGFAHFREYALLWSLLAGSVFVTRDFVQRAIGHWVFVPMAVSVLLSYLMSSPKVAIASACAFAASEAIDWLVYTFTRRPLHQRVLLSSAFAVPIDSLIFLSMVGILSAELMAAQITSKMVAALLVAGGIWGVSRRVAA